jgi:hypothetical protein
MKVFWFAIALFCSSLLHSQSFEIASLISETTTIGKIKGVIFDSESSEDPLVFASVSIKNKAVETTTNLDGFFELEVKPGTYTLTFSFIGYKTITVDNIKVNSNEVTLVNQTLSPTQVIFDVSSLK